MVRRPQRASRAYTPVPDPARFPSDRQLFAGAVSLAEVLREAALHAVEHLVADADVGEGAAHHHIVVAAARAVAVEVGRLHAARLQELRSEEHTSELQSQMRSQYAGFCLK